MFIVTLRTHYYDHYKIIITKDDNLDFLYDLLTGLPKSVYSSYSIMDANGVFYVFTATLSKEQLDKLFSKYFMKKVSRMYILSEENIKLLGIDNVGEIPL